MKKLTLIAAVAFTAMNVHAQARFGIQGGVNFASAQVEAFNPVTNNTEERNTKSNTGATFGFLADIPIVETLSFMPELNFVQKGYEFQNNVGNVVAKAKANLNFIEIPLNFVVRTDIGAGNLFFGLGPAVGFGISGKSEESVSGLGAGFDYSDKEDVEFDGDENATDNKLHLKRVDVGANALAGYMFSNGLFLKVNYTYGFRNLLPDFPAPDDKDTFKTRGLSIKLGYMFGGRKNDSE